MWRALIVLALLGLASAARADSEYSDPAERRFSPYVGDPEPCDNSGAIARIEGQWRTTTNAYWHVDLQILSVDRIRELSLRGDGTEYIPKRYCIARAHMSDDSVHTLIYRTEESLGIIGFGDGIEYCLVGLDRNFAFSPACSSLRPMAERFLGSKALVEKY